MIYLIIYMLVGNLIWSFVISKDANKPCKPISFGDMKIRTAWNIKALVLDTILVFLSLILWPFNILRLIINSKDGKYWRGK